MTLSAAASARCGDCRIVRSRAKRRMHMPGGFLPWRSPVCGCMGSTLTGTPATYRAVGVSYAHYTKVRS